MDKEEFLRILESTSCHNIDNYVYDREWSLLSGLAYSQEELVKKGNLKTGNSVEMEIENEVQTNKKEKNILKILDNDLEESQFYEKIKKDAEDFRISSSHRFSEEFHSNMEQIYKNKSLFFNKYLKSKTNDKNKFPELNILNNFSLEKNFLKKQIHDYFPGLKPSSSWPMALNDLIEKLSNLKLEEMFHQPFDITQSFHYETKEFIRYYFKALQTLINNESEADEIQISIYKEYLEKAIQVFITVKIHEGSYTNFIDMLNFLKDIYEETQNNQLSKSKFSDIFSRALEKCDCVFKKLSDYILSLNETLPIMRNYNISDLFLISKNILFTPNNRNSGPGLSKISITTDSTYFYIIMSGVSGSMLKVGTGMNSTEKGKVYLSKQFDSDDSVSWVFCKSKLYLKKSSNEIGCLDIININTFQIEGKIKLMINESCLHSLIKKKNENYVLLSDREKLKIILLEQKLNPEAQENLKEEIPNQKSEKNKIEDEDDSDFEEDCSPAAEKLRIEKKAKELSNIFSYVSVIMYEYDVENHNDKKLTEEKESLIIELEETFSQLYNKAECKKALIMANWDFEKATLFLIDKAEKIKEPLLLPSGQIILFQSKVDPLIIESRNNEYRRSNGSSSVFDIVVFDEFKWILTEKHLIAYKIRGGYAYIFSLNESDTRFIKHDEYEIYEENYEEIGMKDDSELPLSNIEDVNQKEKLKEFKNENIDIKKIEVVDEDEKNKCQEENSENEIEKKLEKKTIRGTFLKKVNSLELHKQDYSITYDKETHNYYLITDSITSQTILKINTMEDYYNSLTNEFLKNNNYKSIQEIFLKLKNKEYLNNFENFYDLFLEILIIISTRKPDLYSKYRNWNNYLFSQFDRLYNSIDPDSECDISKKLLYYFKIIQSRFEKTLENDFNNIKKDLDENILKNYEIVNQNDESKNELRTYKIKRKGENNNNKTMKIQLDSSKWYFFENYNNVNFQYKNQEKTDKIIKNKKSSEKEKAEFKGVENDNLNIIKNNLEYMFENKTDFYLCPEGNINSLEHILNIIEEALEKSKTQHQDSGSYDKILLNKIFLLYVWFESADVSIGLQFVNSKNNLNYHKGNSKLKSIFEIFSKSLNVIEKLYESKSYKIRNLVFMIVLCGWEYICYDAESQVKWFFRALEHSKDLLKNQKNFDFNKFINKNYNMNNKNVTIETKIAKIILLNELESEQFNTDYLIYLPFKVLLERINNHNEFVFPYMFHRVNKIRILSFKPKLDDPKILSFQQLQVKANPKNLTFPFYWILNSFYIKAITLNSEKDNEIDNSRIKIYQTQFIMEKDLPINEDNKDLSYFVYFDSPNNLGKKGIELNSYENNLKNYLLNKNCSVTENNNCDQTILNFVDFHKNSKKLNSLLKDIIRNNSNFDQFFLQDILNLQSNSFINLIGDLYYLKKNISNLQIVDLEKIKGSGSYEIPDTQRKFDLYLDKFLEILNLNFEKIKDNLNILLDNKESMISFKILRKSLLKHLIFFFYSSFIILRKLNLEQQGLLYEKFIELLNFTTKVLNLNNDILFEKNVKQLKTYTSNGFQIENEKYSEFVLNPNEPLNLMEIINYPEASSIAVEIEYNSFTREKNKFEITVLCQEHGYNNCRNFNSYNNNNNFGTAFLIEIGNHSIKKKLFLPGNEVKIMNANDGRSKFQGRESQNRGPNNNNNSGGKALKNVLKIKCYPIKTQNYLCKNSNIEKEILEKYLIKNKFNEEEFLLWLDYMNDLDYVLNWFIQNNIKSLDIAKDEKMILENSQYVNLFKLGLGKYPNFKISDIKLNMTESQNTLLTSTNTNDKNALITSDFDFTKGKSFKEIYFLIYNSLTEKMKDMKQPNIETFLKNDRKMDYLLSCEENWNEINDDLSSPKILDDYIYQYLLAIIEEEFGINLQKITFKIIKDDIIKSEMKKVEKLDIEKKDKNDKKDTETEDKEKTKNPVIEFYNKFLDQDKILYDDQNKEYIEYFLRLLIRINESNEIINLNLEKNYLFVLLTEIRTIVQEPTNYKNMKRLPSFSQKIKNIWCIIEALFLYCLTYHLNISDKESLGLLLKEIPNIRELCNNDQDSNINSNLKNVIEYLGKKLNNLIFWMSSRVQFMKDSFDTIKYQSEDICSKNNEFLDNVKKLVIEKIALLKKEREDLIQKRLEEEKQKIAASQKKKESKKPKEDNKLPEKTPLEKLKEEMGGNKPYNFKKKSNVKRLYQDISQKKKPASTLNTKKEEIKKEESEKDLNKEEDKLNIPLEELKEKSLDELLKIFPELKAEFLNRENIKLLKEGIKSNIENDIKEAFFGNNEKLKNICEINDIVFSESNPNESLKNYFNFILKKLKVIYDFECYDNWGYMDTDNILEKIYLDSPFKVIADYVLEKILFLFELGNDRLVNILDQNSIINNNSANINNFYRKTLSRKITIGNIQADSKGNENIKIKKSDFEEEAFLTLNQYLIIKSIFAFVFKSHSIDVIRNHMICQNKRLLVRQNGFEKLKKLISFDNYKNYSFISLNSLGILSCSLNNSILNGIETSVKNIDAKSLDLENILIFNLYHINNEINDFLMLNKNNYRNFSLLKSPENSKKEDQCKINNLLDSSNLNGIIEFGNIEPFFVHKLKNLVLILSDINILVTYINNMHSSENSSYIKSHNTLESKKSSLSDEVVNIPLEILKNFIDSSIKIIVNNEINSYSKISKHIGSFSGILKSVLGKLISYKSNEAIYSAVLDSLFSSLQNFNIHSYDDQINSVVNILDLIYYIVSMIPQGNSNVANTKANLNKLLNVLLNSDIPQIVNIASKIAKVFFKNIFSKCNNKSFENENVEEEEKIFTSICKKIGKLWAFKDIDLKKYCIDENQSTLNKLRLNINEDTNKKYYIFVQMNSPEFDYLFFINVLFQWEEMYPTKLSEYKVQILKLLDDIFTEEEKMTLIDSYNKKCEKNEFLNLYKIDYKNIKEKFNSKNYNANKNSKNEFKINLHKFKEMVYFNPLKSKNGKTHTVTEFLNKSTTEIIKKIEENTKKLSDLQIEREKLLKTKEEENMQLNNNVKEVKAENIEVKNEEANGEVKAENIEVKNEEANGEKKEEKKDEELVIQNNINNLNNIVDNKENNQNSSENNANVQIEPKVEENPLPFANGEIPLDKQEEPKKECASQNKVAIEEQEYILKNEIEILKIKELYNKRLTKHIEYAELIGANSSGRGYAVIEGDFTKEKAELFSDLIWRAYYKQLPYVLCPDSIFIPPFKKYSPIVKTEIGIKSNSTENSEKEEQIMKNEIQEEDKNNEDSNKNTKTEFDFDLEFIKDLNYLFDETIIFPNFHEFNTLLPACTNILKETTKQYLNISLMENSVYTKFCETINIFKEKLFVKADPDSLNSKKPISGNFNDIGKKILNEKLINGKSIYIILEELINLIISPCFNNSQKIQDFVENQESHIALFAKLLNNVLRDISNENMKNEIYSDKKFFILGLLIVSSGFFNILRTGSIAELNNNPKDICKIITGGHLTGRQNSNVIFLKDKCTKIEKVSNNNLKKQNHLNKCLKNKESNLNDEFSITKNNPHDSEFKNENTYLTQSSFASNKQGNVNLNTINNIYNTELNFVEMVNFDDLLNAINCAIDTLKLDEKIEINKNIVFFLLKFFNLFGEEVILNNQGQNHKISLIFEKLSSLTEKEKWIEKSEEEWEIEFIDSWQRIYTKLDTNSNKFFSPPKNFLKELKNLYEKNNSKLILEEIKDNSNKNNQEEETYCLTKNNNYINVDKDANELISKLTLPDSAYGADLPKLTDYSKCTLALKNIQIFERYIVEEIFRYCGNTYRDAEYFYALPQIRFNLSLNDIASAKADIYQVFDQTKLPPYTPLPKEHRDMREIFKEECYPGNFYLAKINQKVARETGINYLIKLSNLGLYEVPVLLLLVDTSLNQALVQYDDFMDQSKMNSFWIQLDNLYSLDYNLKLPASSYTMDYLFSEYNSFQNNLIKIYAKNILINLNKFKLNLNNLSPNPCEGLVISKFYNNENSCLNNKFSNEFNMNNFINYLNLEFWQFNKLSPITGVFSSFKNYIKVKQVDELNLRTKESFLNIDNNSSIDIHQILYQLNNLKKKLNQTLSNPDLQNIYESNLEEIEKFLCELCFCDSENLKMLKNWCFESWENLLKEIKHLRFDLFKEYMTQFNLMRTENQINIGNMGNKLLALHELGNINTNNICGIILSFEQSAILGPNAKLSFYSDKEGVNLIHEITAIKNTKSNLQSIIFNYSKIWMNYTPGTRAFYIHDWHMQTRDSNLPCCLSFIPHYWSCLIWLSDFTTSSLFSSYSLDNLEIFKEYIKKLLGFCSSTKIPVDLQTNIFNITNRIILKANKYIQELENRKLINFEILSLYEKMGLIGIDEFTLIELIKHIDRFNTMISTESKDKNFSSSYVVDGVEIILSILSVIKESYHNLDFYFRENFDYSLPIWIEAIIKLGQFLNLFQNVSQLESELSREIISETANKDKIYDIFIIKNIPGYIENQIIINEVKKNLSSLNMQICDTDIDIVIIDKNRDKFDLIFNKNILKNTETTLITNTNEKLEESETSKKEEAKEVMIESGNIEMQNKNKDENKIDSEKNELEINTVLIKEREDKVASVNKFCNIDKNYTKELCILIDGVKVETLREVSEPIEEVEESTLWKCAGCEMENDMENLNCIFCDMEKTVKPKEKKKKQTLIKVDSYIQTINDVLSEFKNGLKNNSNLNTFIYEVPFIEKQEEEVKCLEKISDPDSKKENCEPLKIEENAQAKENINNEENNKKIENSQKLINEKIVKDLEIFTPEEIKRNKNLFKDLLSDFYKIRIYKWISQRSTDIKEIINDLKFYTSYKGQGLDQIKSLIDLYEKDSKQFETIFPSQSSKQVDINTISSLSESTNQKSEVNKFYDINFLSLMQDLEVNNIDVRLEITELNENQLRENINLEILEKIREIIDLNICKETNISFVLPPKAVRFTQEDLNSLNCFNSNKIKKAISPNSYNLAQIRYYWSIIKYFNNCLLAALPFIKPPDMNPDNSIPNNGEFTYIPFPKSISAFLSSAKGLTFSFTKQNLINQVIAYTEFPEEQIQIPTFKFERLNIFNNLTEDKNKQNKIENNDPTFIRNENLIGVSNNEKNKISNDSNDNEEDENSNGDTDLKVEESMFLQAYEQFKDIDIAFFRSKKAPGDPHIGFKVEFKGEFVQGIGGPYRQFFSDISSELQPKDVKGDGKILKLLYPSSNKQAEKGDFKDKYVIRPLLSDNNSMKQFEFLGVLMGICIRTGVHLTLDLCSIFWKKLTEESINVEDIREFDEGLLEQINFLKNEIDQETFENSLNKTYCIELTDNSLFELIPGGNEKKVNFEDRFTYMKLLIKARLSESDTQIAAIKRGLCKIVPYSLIKLMTYKELEQQVCGKKMIDIDLLKSNTVYSLDLSADSDRSIWLWEILRELSEEEKVKFIKFCWGQERLPATKEEYEKLQINFKIKPHIDKKRKDIFPKADTCFFSLELPEYSAKDIMKKMILTAINYDNVSINADKVNNENYDHRRNDNRDNYDDESE